jgi:Holliday junction resolvasome RuvABC endonuclease subunit
MKTILAIDLATTTGWAVSSCNIITSGTVSFKGGRFEGGGMRFLRFRRWLREMLESEKPDVLFYEEVRRHLSTDSAHIYGGLLAIMQAECEAKEIPYSGIPVGTIKKHATGKGGADKKAMIAAAAARWPDQSIESDDQADALWILDCGRHGAVRG